MKYNRPKIKTGKQNIQIINIADREEAGQLYYISLQHIWCDHELKYSCNTQAAYCSRKCKLSIKVAARTL